MPSITPSEDKPRLAWRDYSFEYKSMFAYHLAMMAMFLTGWVPVPYEVAIAGFLIVLFAAVSLDRRRQLGWRWPPRRALDFAKAAGALVVAAIMIVAGLPLFKPDNPHIVPWYLALVGIALFNVLQQLKLVATSEAEFQGLGAAIGPRTDAPVPVAGATPVEPSWHRGVRGFYNTAGVVLWLAFMAFFYLNGVAIKEGAPQPTATQTEPIPNHGDNVYVTEERFTQVHTLQIVSMAGIPLLILSGLGLQILGGVRIFPGGINFFGKRFS